MVYSSPPTFIPPPGASLLQRYRGRIIFCFLLTLAAAFAWVYLEVKPGYLAEAEYRLIPVQPESPLLRHPASEQPLSLQVALLSEETLASDALLDKSPYLAIQPGGPGGRIKISCLGEVETKAKELLETASKQLQATHAAGQQERREVLAKQLQAALADLERRQAPLKLESITHLNNLKIPEAAQAEILAAGLDSQAVTDRLAAYRASYAA
ncbi:MAG: hypothetical protein JXA52_01750, partial [Planctomycetes bacterium]|nr:hypothetical protein [Planctomycetota bacterium]